MYVLKKHVLRLCNEIWGRVIFINKLLKVGRGTQYEQVPITQLPEETFQFLTFPQSKMCLCMAAHLLASVTPFWSTASLPQSKAVLLLCCRWRGRPISPPDPEPELRPILQQMNVEKSERAERKSNYLCIRLQDLATPPANRNSKFVS